MNRVQARAFKVGWLTLALTLVLVAGWLVIRGEIAPEVRVAPEVPLPVVERLGPAPEDGGAAEPYAEMIEDRLYNAAFAVNDAGGFGWADNHARIEEAEQFAMAHCVAQGPGCRIILRIVPEHPVHIDDLPLSRTAAEALSQYPGRPRSKAIALTGHGGWGAAWDRRSRRAAVEAALEWCREHETTTAPDLELTTECRVIWTD